MTTLWQVDQAAAEDPRVRRARHAIFAVVALMLASCLVVPVMALFQEPSPVQRWLGAAGLVLLIASTAAALHSVMSQRRRLTTWAFLVTTALSTALVAPLGPADLYTWSWIGGAAAGFVTILLTGVTRWLAVGVLLGVAVGVGAFTGGSLSAHAAIAVSIAAVILVAILLPMWLWELLLSARAGREAAARLAVTEERLRFARDVHDLLGHRLAVIALKAELSARLSEADPVRARQEALDVQHLAATALTEVREAVDGYRTIDPADQLQAIEDVLTDAGITCTVTRAPLDLPPATATQLALVLREGCTNVLRHSTARWCTIKVNRDQEEVSVTMTNDGAVASTGDRLSHGLRGAADRLAEVGGSLRTSLIGDEFTLEARLPVT